MNQNRWSIALLLGCVALLASVPASARYYDGDRYSYCRQQAERLSGYYGPVPDRYLPGGVGRGVARGAVAGAVIGGIAGGDAKKAARRGAITGAVVGAVRRERARDEQRDRRYIFELELDRCMDGYR